MPPIVLSGSPPDSQLVVYKSVRHLANTEESNMAPDTHVKTGGGERRLGYWCAVYSGAHRDVVTVGSLGLVPGEGVTPAGVSDRMGNSLGQLPNGYNKAVHGPYDPAVFYGKKVGGRLVPRSHHDGC